MIAVFAALRLEVQRFLRRVDVRERARLGRFPVTLGEYEGRPLLVCFTGIGSRAAEAAATVLGRYRPESVLSVGLAGALSPECAVGDLVFCEKVYRAEPESETGRADGPMLSDLLLLEAARRACSGRGLSAHTGSSLTTSCLVTEPRHKTLLRQATGMDVVEMESYWVGRAALEQRLPFLAVRAISDGVEDPVVDIPGAVTPEGDQRVRKVLPYVLRHPGSIPHLLRLAGGELKAVASLTRFLEAFVRACRAPSLAKPA
jgi:adenosylhomocysteine nucleosidase